MKCWPHTPARKELESGTYMVTLQPIKKSCILTAVAVLNSYMNNY
jgi:hypothetical protein